MSNTLGQNNLNDLHHLNLEYYDAQYHYWTKAELLGISGESEYIVKISRELNEYNLINTNACNLRIVSLLNYDFDINNKNNISNTNSYCCEYSINQNSFIPCEIINHKGKFYSLKLSLPSSIPKVISKIAREKEIRKITFKKFSEFLDESFGNITIKIPDDLKIWANSDNESFIDLITNLTQDFSLCYYSSYTNPAGTNKYIRIFSYKKHLTTIQLMIEVAIQNELKLLKFESDKNTTLQKLHNVKKELDKIKKFYISKELVGLLIGVKGANINRLKQKYEVNIVVQTEIAGDDALVTITGENEKFVEECVNESKFAKKSYELKPNAESKVKIMIPDLIQKNGLIKMFITRDKYKDEKRGVYYLTYLNIIGTEQSLEEAIKSKELIQYIVV